MIPTGFDDYYEKTIIINSDFIGILKYIIYAMILQIHGVIQV